MVSATLSKGFGRPALDYKSVGVSYELFVRLTPHKQIRLLLLLGR